MLIDVGKRVKMKTLISTRQQTDENVLAERLEEN